MEQNIEQRKQSLSTASMLAAIGATLMYGLTILIALIEPGSQASGVISLIGLILLLVGMYNMTSALRGINDAVVATLKSLFKANVMIIGSTLVCTILIVILVNSMTWSNATTIGTINKILAIAWIVGLMLFTSQCRTACVTLSKSGLPSMKHCGVGYTIQLAIISVFGLFLFIALFNTGHATSFFGSLGFRGSMGLIGTLLIIIGIASLIMCVFMILGWWSVRSELQRLLDTPDQAQNI